MRKEMDYKSTSAVLGVLLCCLLGLSRNLAAAEAIEGPATQDSNSAELKIDGEHIERLVLIRRDGKKEEITAPGVTVALPQGEYRLLEAHLKGDYSCIVRPGYGDWIAVSKDKPAVLKVGGPVSQKVNARRQGNVLVLSYQLLGAGGEPYTSANRNKKPLFAIFKGDKKIASGSFEYG